jgi:hypothetical protein
MKKQTRRIAKNEKGMATIETLPLLFIFLFLTSYSLGFFGIIHTGIMNSISSRAYAFETFRNRSSLLYFRDTPGGDRRHYKNSESRTHMVLDENREESDAQMRVTERPLRIGIPLQPGPSRQDGTIHNDKLFEPDSIVDRKRNQKIEVSPVWIMVQYGICLNVKCGERN